MGAPPSGYPETIEECMLFDIDWSYTKYWFTGHYQEAIADLGWALGGFLRIYKAAAPTAVDMSAILKAMSEAEPHQPLLFMGYFEAYQASVWNASFDEHFFADLVKKWSIWE